VLQVYDILSRAMLLNDENRALIHEYPKPIPLVDALATLARAMILTQENFERLLGLTSVRELAFLINKFQHARILNQESFEALTQKEYAYLLSSEAARYFWSLIPQDALTHRNFARIRIAALNPHPLVALTALRLTPKPRVVVPQTTHTASVHRSVSVSALKLKQRYWHPELDVDDILGKLKSFIMDSAERPNVAVLRCVERLTHSGYRFMDKSSLVSTRELLVLTYLAIHDKAHCCAHLDDAKALLISGFDEIQRGYNDEDSPEVEDYPICPVGSFNKIMEKLNGIHVDVEVYLITQMGASLKFPKLVQHFAFTYLMRCASPSTEEDYHTIARRLATLTSTGTLVAIWAEIQSSVENALWEEFLEAYAGDRNHPAFRALVEQVDAVALPDLRPIEEQLSASRGYRYHRLWSERHRCTEAQHEFDQCFGLTLSVHPQG